MANLIYDTFWDLLRAGVLQSPTVRCMLVNGYVPDVAHTVQSDVTDEVDAPGYIAGGVTVLSLSQVSSGELVLTLGNAAWPSLTTSVTGAVYYAVQDGSQDLMCYIDLNEPVVGGLLIAPTSIVLSRVEDAVLPG